MHEFYQQPKLLTPKEAADVIGYSADTLKNWRNTGLMELPFHKLGKSIRYDLQDLEDFKNGK
ncbi:helix-turn-helix domain-containing protein [Shewanella sp. KX20019]|nr:helix-turn-helix domain-containing protein [Shewanella sp. KX20019]